MENNDDIIKIDLWRLITACLKRWWLILIVTVAFGGAAYAYSKTTVPSTYQSTIKIYVNTSTISVGNVSMSSSSVDFGGSAKLVDLYEVLLNTKDTLDRVIEKAGLDYSYGQVMDMLATASVNDTQVFRVTVTSTSPTEAQLIASTIGEVLPQVISEIVDSADARIVEHAIVPTYSVGPNHSQAATKGALIGFVLAVAFLVVIELADNTLKNENDLLDIVGVPVLTHIPDFNDNSAKTLNNYNRNYFQEEP